MATTIGSAYEMARIDGFDFFGVLVRGERGDAGDARVKSAQARCKIQNGSVEVPPFSTQGTRLTVTGMLQIGF